MALSFQWRSPSQSVHSKMTSSLLAIQEAPQQKLSCWKVLKTNNLKEMPTSLSGFYMFLKLLNIFRNHLGGVWNHKFPKLLGSYFDGSIHCSHLQWNESASKHVLGKSLQAPVSPIFSCFFQTDKSNSTKTSSKSHHESNRMERAAAWSTPHSHGSHAHLGMENERRAFYPSVLGSVHVAHVKRNLWQI